MAKSADIRKNITDTITHLPELAKGAAEAAKDVNLADLPARAVNTGLVLAGKAQEQVEALAAEGTKLVHKVRSDKNTKAIVDQAEEAVAKAKTALTSARKAVVETGDAAGATLRTGRNEAAHVVDTVTEVIEKDAALVADMAKKSAAKTASAARRTSATAKKTTESASQSAKVATESATKSATKSAKVVADTATKTAAKASTSVKTTAAKAASASKAAPKASPASTSAPKTTSTAATKSAAKKATATPAKKAPARKAPASKAPASKPATVQATVAASVPTESK